MIHWPSFWLASLGTLAICNLILAGVQISFQQFPWSAAVAVFCGLCAYAQWLKIKQQAEEAA